MGHKVGIIRPDALVQRIGALYDSVVVGPAHISRIFGSKLCGICIAQCRNLGISDYFAVISQRPSANAPLIVKRRFFGIQVRKQADNPVRILGVLIDQRGRPAHVVLRRDNGFVIIITGKLPGIPHDCVVVAGIQAQLRIGYICFCGGCKYPSCRNFLFKLALIHGKAVVRQQAFPVHLVKQQHCFPVFGRCVKGLEITFGIFFMGA